MNLRCVALFQIHATFDSSRMLLLRELNSDNHLTLWTLGDPLKIAWRPNFGSITAVLQRTGIQSIEALFYKQQLIKSGQVILMDNERLYLRSTTILIINNAKLNWPEIMSAMTMPFASCFLSANTKLFSMTDSQGWGKSLFLPALQDDCMHIVHHWRQRGPWRHPDKRGMGAAATDGPQSWADH